MPLESKVATGMSGRWNFGGQLECRSYRELISKFKKDINKTYDKVY